MPSALGETISYVHIKENEFEASGMLGGTLESLPFPRAMIELAKGVKSA